MNPFHDYFFLWIDPSFLWMTDSEPSLRLKSLDHGSDCFFSIKVFGSPVAPPLFEL